MSEINPGVWDGLTVADAKREYPEEWERFVKDPYSFRAPRAESYHDLSGTFLHFRLALGPVAEGNPSPIGADAD
jgi:broad specificity phosphatase PhoE